MNIHSLPAPSSPPSISAPNPTPLYDKLTAYAKEPHIPFHMPGHKRQLRPEYLPSSLPWQIDITEIDGFDNLHHAEGILKESMAYAARYYNVQRSLYSVNGSTACLLSAVFAAAKPGETILMGRNCHKSVYHGVFLRNLRPRYLYPQTDEKTGIDCGYLPSDLEKELTDHPEIRAVILTSPTYEGILTDIAEMEEIIRPRGIPLIVDEAHGAHLHNYNFDDHQNMDSFPPGAAAQGADLVIQSLHKTLPALTQTAVLHIGKYASLRLAEEAARYMEIFQTSSPSYVLLSSIDSCLHFLASPKGIREKKHYCQKLTALRSRLKKAEKVHLLEPGQSRDPSKLILAAEGLTGRELYDYLRIECHVQPEACMDSYVILMTSIWDTEKMYEILCQSIEKLDRILSNPAYMWEKFHKNTYSLSLSHSDKYEKKSKPIQIFAPFEADLMEKEEIFIADSAGRISGESLWLYPPGIPLLVPGEKIGEDWPAFLSGLLKAGKSLHGIKDQSGKKIQVLQV